MSCWNQQNIMKLLAVLPVFASAAKVRPTCDAPPAELAPGTTWDCINGDGKTVVAPFQHFDACYVQGAGCSGYKVCYKGAWKGKPKCPKNCVGTPDQPSYGGSWSCSGQHHSTCSFTEDKDFSCDISGVSCNEKQGNWRGQTKCRYDNTRPMPEDRPNGVYNCRDNGKCTFSCDDGSYAGRMYFNRKNGEYTSETNWYYCCPAPSCKNGVAHPYDHKNVSSTCPPSTCKSCDAGYELVGDSCDLKTTLPPVTTTPDEGCHCINGDVVSESHCEFNAHYYSYNSDSDVFHWCETCDEGYYKYHNYWYDYYSSDIITCEPNSCTCENGKSSSPCTAPHGSEICASCDSGFELLQEACVPSFLKEFCFKADPVDVVFVVDGSGSVGLTQFMQELNFLRSVSAAMHLGPDKTRIALVQYSSSYKVEFDFISDPTQVVGAFANIVYQGGGTRTGAAINFAYNNVIVPGARPGVEVKMVVVTDGRSGDDVRVQYDSK